MAAAGSPAAAHADPVILDASTATASSTWMSAVGAIIAAASAVAVAHNPNPNPNPPHTPPHAPPLDWYDAPFDVGIHLDTEAPATPLWHDENERESRSDDDDDSIFVDLSRD
jgi:hypothetical protein